MKKTFKRKSMFSLYMPIYMLLLAALACSSATTDNVRILDVPQFICPTSTPVPTHTQVATQVQPNIQIPPSGYVTYTPLPGCIWNGIVCATNTPFWGGMYSTPGYSLPGATSTPRPTFTPWPSATPYIMTGGFHLGADVYVGGVASPVNIRLRIEDVIIYPIDETRQVVSWAVEIENVGDIAYFAIPGGQVFVARITTAEGTQQGQWWASQEAAAAAGITLQAEVLDALEIEPGSNYHLILTAFTPVGEPESFGWALDPISGGRDGDMTGGNVAYWFTDTSTDCVGNLAPGAILPTPVVAPPSATPSQTPEYPDWCTWCGN